MSFTNQEEQRAAESLPGNEEGVTEGGENASAEEDTLSLSPQGENAAPVAELQAPDLYDAAKCDLHFTITMRRDDGDPHGRQILLGARNDNDVPMITLVRAHDLESILAPLVELHDRLVADLPRRKKDMQAGLEAARKRKPEAAKQARQRNAAQEAPETSQTSSRGQAAQADQPSANQAPSPPPSATPRSSSKRKGKASDAESQMEQMTLF